MSGLYPIIRRVRRPVVGKPEAAVAASSSVLSSLSAGKLQPQVGAGVLPKDSPRLGGGGEAGGLERRR